MKSLPMTPGFSFARLKQIITRLMIINKKTYALGVGGTLVGLYAFWLMMAIFNSENSPLEISMGALTLGTYVYRFAGYLLTASIFNELHSPGSASQFLTLPATTGEKLFSSWIISFVLYTIVAFIGISLLLCVIILTGNLFFDLELHSLSELFNAYVKNMSLSYLFFNSVFLLGAVYFKGNNFLKTAFSILLFLAFVGFLLIAIISFAGPENLTFWIALPYLFETDSKLLLLLVELLFTLPLTALFLTFSYFRLKNRQVA